MQFGDEVLEQWREHIKASPNHPPGVHSATSDDKVETSLLDTDTTVAKPSLGEFMIAIKRLRNGHAPDSVGILVELLECAIGPAACTLHFLFIHV